jgi:eukaryotic-like serine/threonine-protein kinase
MKPSNCDDALRDDLALKTGASPVAASQSHYPLLKYGIAAVAVLILTGGGIFLWQQRRQSKPLKDKDVLVLADFANTTGDPVFGGTLRQALAIQLEQSPFLKIMADEQMRQTLATDEPTARSPHHQPDRTRNLRSRCSRGYH